MGYESFMFGGGVNKMVSIVGLDKKKCEQLAMDPSSSPEVLNELSKHESDDVRAFVARNSSSPVEVIVSLAEDDTLQVIKSAALNPELPEQVALKLASHRYLIVRLALSQNPSLSLNVVNVLLKDAEPIIREMVAGNSCVPLERLYQLVFADSSSVRAGVASNPSSDFNVWAALVKDSSPLVSARAEYNLTSLSDTAFREALRAANREEWAELPREWVMRAVGQ